MESSDVHLSSGCLRDCNWMVWPSELNMWRMMVKHTLTLTGLNGNHSSGDEQVEISQYDVKTSIKEAKIGSEGLTRGNCNNEGYG